MEPVVRIDPLTASRSAQRPRPDAEIARVGARQGGVIGRGQLLWLGLRPGGIDARVARGALHVLHPGVYAVGHPRVLGLGLDHAALLAAGPGAVRGVRSAGAADDLRGWSRSSIDVIAPRSRRSRPGVRIFNLRLDPVEIAVVDGIPTTTIARTLFDLAEVLPAEPFKRTWEEGIRQDVIDLRALRAVVARNPGRRALKAIRPFLETPVLPGVADTRSPLEVDFVEFAASHLSRFGPPRINHPFGDFVLDAFYEEPRLAVELDSREFHLNPVSFETDRAKQAACLAAGIVIFPLTSRRLHGEPLMVADQLTTIITARRSGPAAARCAD